MARTATLSTPDFSANYTITFDEITDWENLELEELSQVELGQDSVDGNLFGSGEDIITGNGDIVVENPPTTAGRVSVSVDGEFVTIGPGESHTFEETSSGNGDTGVVSITSYTVSPVENGFVADITVSNERSVEMTFDVVTTVSGSEIDREPGVLSAGETQRFKVTGDLNLSPGEEVDIEVCAELDDVQEVPSGL